MAWDDGLDECARRIAQTNHSPLLVWAGPGTGKTRALIRRVARLLEGGHDPRRILAVTFTRTAAHDLVTKLRELKVPGCNNVRASTLHSFCFGTLAKQDVFDLISRVPRPLLRPSKKIRFEVDFLLHDIPDRFGGIRERDRRLRAFEAAWARLQSEEPGWPQNPIDRDFQAELDGWLRFHKAMLIGEVVPVTLSYIRDNPACDERGAFDHVLVDEYQDLNKAEQVLLALLADGGNFAVAGDDDQSIYSFKFAHPEGIMEFPQNHSGTHTENLAESQRCPVKIIEMANCLISNNKRPDPARRILPAPRATPGEIDIVQWRSLEEEARGLAQAIDLLITAGSVAPKSVLVLAPRRVIGYAIRDALQQLRVDAHCFFPDDALDSKDAQERFTLLTLVANPKDRVALRCWLGFGDHLLRKKAYACLRKHCEQGGSEPREVLEDLESGRLSIPGTTDLVSRFRGLKAELAQLQNLELRPLIEQLFPDDQPAVEAIRGLALEAMDSCRDASRLREELRVRITQPELPSEGEFVRVMSLHKGKGLTADLVVVAGCIRGFLPYVDDDMSPTEQQQLLEEQRRLFYMAITRTTRHLVLSSFTDMNRAEAHRMQARIRAGGGNRGGTMASQFLGELGSGAPKPIRGQQLLTKLRERKLT